MAYNLSIPTQTDPNYVINLNTGEMLFVVGSNGAGKSSLMQHLYTQNVQDSQRINAYRQNYFHSHAVEITAERRRSSMNELKNYDNYFHSVFSEYHSPASRIQTAIYDLVEVENKRARLIAKAVDEKDFEQAKELSDKRSALTIINHIFRQSNLPIEIFIKGGGEFFARKNGGKEYPINQMSDGERNALIVCAIVLTANEGTLFLIDEPERHLHHSISSSLFSLLLAERSDCGFVVSTHDLALPASQQASPTLLVRACTHREGGGVENWDIDLLPANMDIPAVIKEGILGARRKVLYIEGTVKSLDLPLYSLIFPGISILPQSSCKAVEGVVGHIRTSEALHWLQAYGIVDNDARAEEDIRRLREGGIYALSVYSVESIYYHPEIQRRVAERQTALLGGDAGELIKQAGEAFVREVGKHKERMSARMADKRVRELVFAQLPTMDSVQHKKPVEITIDVKAIVEEEVAKLDVLLEKGEITTIIQTYPIRETGALGHAVKSFQFTSRDNYEAAVRKLLMDDASVLASVRSFFGTLPEDITQ